MPLCIIIMYICLDNYYSTVDIARVECRPQTSPCSLILPAPIIIIPDDTSHRLYNISNYVYDVIHQLDTQAIL